MELPSYRTLFADIVVVVPPVHGVLEWEHVAYQRLRILAASSKVIHSRNRCRIPAQKLVRWAKWRNSLTRRLELAVIQGFIFGLGNSHETYLPAFRRAPQAYPWLSRTHAHPWRQGGDPRSSCQGSSSSRCLSKRFRPAQRLHTPRDYSAVFAARQVVRSTCFDLLRGGLNEPASGNAVSRLGLVIPKRLARRAVLRNTIKRQAREVFRQQCESLPPVDLVLRLARWPKETAALVATPSVLKRSLRLEMTQLLTRLARQYAPPAVQTGPQVD